MSVWQGHLAGLNLAGKLPQGIRFQGLEWRAPPLGAFPPPFATRGTRTAKQTLLRALLRQQAHLGNPCLPQD